MQPPDALPTTSPRLLALSGVVFAVQWKSRIGAFAMLLAGFVFLHFAATIRTVLGNAERKACGSAELARVASRVPSRAWQA